MKLNNSNPAFEQYEFNGDNGLLGALNTLLAASK
jgi:hypothetical protein